MAKRQYWGAYDLETSRYMQTGLNSHSKKELVDAIFDYWESLNDEFDDKEVKQIAKDKEGWVKNLHFRLDVQDEPYYESI